THNVIGTVLFFSSRSRHTISKRDWSSDVCSSDLNKEYEVEIELESDGTYTAEIEDDLNDEYIKGQEAFDKLYPMVKALDVNPDSSKDDVFDQVLSAFDLDSDYDEI